MTTLNPLRTPAAAEDLEEMMFHQISELYLTRGFQGIMELVDGWMNYEIEGEENSTQAKMEYISEKINIAFQRLGVRQRFNFTPITVEEMKKRQKEQEFIEKLKKTTFGIIEVMLEKIDEKKQDMKENDYLKIMEHLKLMWDMVEEVKNHEQAIKSKEIVNKFWKTIIKK